MATIHHLHRIVELPPTDAPDLIDALRQRAIWHERHRSFGERLVDFFRLNGEMAVGLIVGSAFGCLLTVALAWVWSWFL